MTLTCIALAAAVALPQPATTLRLAPGQDCPAVRVATYYPKRVTIYATGSRLRGLVVTPLPSDAARAGNVRVVGPRIVAPAGIRGVAASGYAVQLVRAEKVVLDGVTLTDATYGLVAADSVDVSLRRALVTGYRADGVQATRTRRLTITRVRFEDARPDPTRCTVAGVVTLRLSSRACLALGGDWRDGTHTDAVQLRGVTTALISDVVVRGATAGIVDFRGVDDPVSTGIRVQRADVAADTPNPIALREAEASEVRDSVVARAPGSAWRATIKAGPGVLACGNRAEDSTVGTGPCPVQP